MKCFYRELSQRKKFLITELNNEIASIEWLWFQKEINDEEYKVRYDSLQRRIRELKGWHLPKASIRYRRNTSSINSMTSSTFFMREKKSQQIGNYLLDEITPKQLKADMDKNQHALSDRMLKDPSWEYFVWNGAFFTSPMMALRGAEKHGLNQNTPIPIADIVNSVNNYLTSLGKKTITDNSVLSNLKKAAKYLNTAYNLVLRPDSLNMTVTLLSAAATDKEIAKWYNQMESRLEKIITLAQHAKNSDFEHLPSLPLAKQKFLKLNEAFNLESGNENE